MAEAWIMVRLRRGTEARLRVVEQSMRRAHEQGKIALDFDSQGRVSLDQIVDYLLDFKAGHAERSKRAGQRRGKAKKEKGTGVAERTA